MEREQVHELELAVADLTFTAGIINHVVWDLALQVADLHEQLIEAGASRDKKERIVAWIPNQREHDARNGSVASPL